MGVTTAYRSRSSYSSLRPVETELPRLSLPTSGEDGCDVEVSDIIVKILKIALVRMRDTMLLWKHSWWCALIKKPTGMTATAHHPHDRTVLSGLVEFLGEGIALFFSLSVSKLQNANLISVEAKPEVRDVQVKVNKPATSGDLATWERVRRLFWKSSKFCEQYEAALLVLLFLLLCRSTIVLCQRMQSSFILSTMDSVSAGTIIVSHMYMSQMRHYVAWLIFQTPLVPRLP